MNSLVVRIGLFVTIFLSIPVLLSINFPPDEYYWAGIASLIIPIFLLSNLIGVLYFLFKRSKWFIVPILILISSFPIYSKLFSFYTNTSSHGSFLKVLSYNVDSFKYFSKSNVGDFESNKDSFESWVASNHLDILCLQEMVEPGKEPYLIDGYEKASSLKITKEGDNLGVFIFSKYPIIRQGEIEFAKNSYNRLMWVDIVAFGDTIRVANVHLMSYDFNNGTFFRNLRAIRTGVMARSWHTKLIYQFINNSPYPLVLTGDFNEAPYSYSYRKINSVLTDTYTESGVGFDYTFLFFGFPFRIDHVFIDPKLTSAEYDVIHGLNQWSNHSPVLVCIGLLGLVE